VDFREFSEIWVGYNKISSTLRIIISLQLPIRVFITRLASVAESFVTLILSCPPAFGLPLAKLA